MFIFNITRTDKYAVMNSVMNYVLVEGFREEKKRQVREWRERTKAESTRAAEAERRAREEAAAKEAAARAAKEELYRSQIATFRAQKVG